MMKKLFLVIICFYLIMSHNVLFAFDTQIPAYKLLDAVSSTGPGEKIDIGSILSKHTCCVTWEGTTPTNTIVALEGSIDNTIFVALSTATVTASTPCWHTVNKPIRYVRGNYVSKSGGDATTSMTMKCIHGGN